MGIGNIFRGLSDGIVKLYTHLYIASRVRMSGAFPLTPPPYTPHGVMPRPRLTVIINYSEDNWDRIRLANDPKQFYVRLINFFK
jgi:hypothetical protein